MKIEKFFLDNFKKIKNIDDIKDHFNAGIKDITEEKERQQPGLLTFMNHEFIGQSHHDFTFRDSRNYWGELDVDFMEGVFRNARCKLFGEGLISNFFGLKQKYKKTHKLFSEKFGKPAKFDLMAIPIPGVNTIYWVDHTNNLYITLSENKKQFPKIRPYVSFGVEQTINPLSHYEHKTQSQVF